MRNEFLTTEEAAELLRVTTRSLQRMRKRGSGPLFIQLTPGQILYRRADIESWLELRTKTRTTGRKG